MSCIIVCPKNPLHQSDLPTVSAFLFAQAKGLEKDHSEKIYSKLVSSKMSILLCYIIPTFLFLSHLKLMDDQNADSV